MEKEEYKVICFSTCHLEKSDINTLTLIAEDKAMVMERDEGFFIKLYRCDGDSIEEQKKLNINSEYSSALSKIISFALNEGYSMIEFDRDASIYDSFQRFDW